MTISRGRKKNRIWEKSEMLDAIPLAAFPNGNRTIGDICQASVKRLANSLPWLRSNETGVETAMFKRNLGVSRSL